MNTQNLSRCSVWAFIALSVAGIAPQARAESIEIAIASVLAPEHGFDDNDEVKFLVHGNLPNSCYILSDTQMTASDDGRTIEIRQFAAKRPEDLCISESDLPMHLTMVVPFTREVTLGKDMAAAEYRLQYSPHLKSRTVKTRTISVERAQSQSIDNFSYALIEHALTPTSVKDSESLHLTLSGTLNSTCTDLGEIQVETVGDTVIVKPTLIVKKGMCMQVRVPFLRTVDLGKHEQGEKLIHVRSMGGKALNQIVEIMAE